MNYFLARLSAMYPLYLVAIFISIIHLLVSCNPSTFDSDFHWTAQADDKARDLFCEPSPYIDSWGGNFVMTILVYLTGLQATPLWTVSWFLGFYLWFSSTFYFCLAIYPFVYDKLWRFRGQVKPLQIAMALTLLVNYGICLAYWFGWNDSDQYPDACKGFPDLGLELGGLNGTANASLTGNITDLMRHRRHIPGDVNTTTTTTTAVAGCHDGDASDDNLAGLGFYLFPPFWMPYFVAGIIAAYLFDALRPNEQHNSMWWGVLGDACTVLILALSIAQITEGQGMRPDEADYASKAAISGRLWDNLYPRLLAPVTVLWVYCIATGEGVFAKLCRWPFLVDVYAAWAFNLHPNRRQFSSSSVRSRPLTCTYNAPPCGPSVRVDELAISRKAPTRKIYHRSFW